VKPEPSPPHYLALQKSKTLRRIAALGGDNEMHQYAVAGGLVALLTLPALAADEFYVAQDPVAKDCKIVKDKPDGKSLIMLGTSSYSTRDAAKAAKKTAPECRPQGDD
jgi:hypothetical protein